MRRHDLLPCCFVCFSKLEVSLPDIDYIEIPAPWWDAEADKSLLIGVHKHGEDLDFYSTFDADCRICVVSLSNAFGIMSI